MHVAPQRNTAVVKSLKCGTKYFFILTAFNNAGRGEPSEEIMAKTKGGGNSLIYLFFFYFLTCMMIIVTKQQPVFLNI